MAVLQDVGWKLQLNLTQLIKQASTNCTLSYWDRGRLARSGSAASNAEYQTRAPRCLRARRPRSPQFGLPTAQKCSCYADRMLTDILGAIWRGAPKAVRRWTMRVWHPRFAVTTGAVITDRKGRVLLLKHRFRPGSGWGVPGGFLEKGEQPEAALRRELREEIGLEVEQLQLFTTHAFKKPKQVEIIFCCRAVGEPEELNFEIQKAAWFLPAELPAELPESQARLIKRVLSDGATPQN